MLFSLFFATILSTGSTTEPVRIGKAAVVTGIARGGTNLQGVSADTRSSHAPQVTRSSSPMGANSSSKAAAGPSVLDHESIWAGHQVVFGKRSIPVLGDIETRTDTWVLADVTEKEDGFVLRQRACHITFAPVMGVEVHIKPTALSLLPQATIHFSQTAPGRFEAEPWIVAWATEDRDRDGNPGVTIQATSSLCTGSLYVASANTSWARGRKVGGALKGQIRVRVQQEVLDASTWCLRAGSKNTDELQQGQFAYTPVPPGTTCANLRRRGWPVSAGK